MFGISIKDHSDNSEKEVSSVDDKKLEDVVNSFMWHDKNKKQIKKIMPQRCRSILNWLMISLIKIFFLR